MTGRVSAILTGAILTGAVLTGLNATTLAAVLAFGLTAAPAQFGAPPLAADRFRPQAPAQQPSAPRAAPLAKPPAAPALLSPAIAPAIAARPAIAAISQSREATYDEGTIERMKAALQRYSAIEMMGGWPALPATARLGPGSRGPEVALLRRRLAITGDLAKTSKDEKTAEDETFDTDLAAAVSRFQVRHGLAETGSVGPQTLAQLNVPAAARVRALEASIERLSAMSFLFGYRYVVVNIPAAAVEAVTNGQVEKRYVAVVGKPERPSPTLTTQITAVNLNPTWTVPLSIVKKDIVPKVRKDPGYLARMNMRLLDAQGGEIDPRRVDWSSERTPNVTIRQDSGNGNALGNIRIDMPNPHAVYMHDTNHRNLFSADYRFQSSGCTRVAEVRDFAAWVLRDTEWGRREIDAGIARGGRTDIRLPRAIPVAWIYLTGWASRDGTVHFRPDIYKHDERQARQFMVSLPKPIVSAARAQGFSLQSADERPAVLKEVSYLDSQ